MGSLSEEKLLEFERLVEQVNNSASNQPLEEDLVKKIEELLQYLNHEDDTVFQVNCLQLFADLACSSRAMPVLERHQVPEKLIQIIKTGDALIIPHALKLFYRVNPLLLETKYSPILDIVCEYCQSDDRRLLDYAVDFIAAVGRGGYLARMVLDRHPNFKQKCLSRLGSSIVSSDSLIKSRTLRCIADLLEIYEDDPREESSKLSEVFYHHIIEGEQKMTNQLMILCRVPFIEIRVNALLVVSTVASTDWGQRELAAHPNFVRWILDRSTETAKESKEAKFEILKTIVKSRTASRHFKGEDYLKMRADFKQGPFHKGIAEEMLLDDQQAT